MVSDTNSRCSALTIKGSPCRNKGTIPLGSGEHLCSAHAQAALRASERPAPVKPERAPSPKTARPLADLTAHPSEVRQGPPARIALGEGVKPSDLPARDRPFCNATINRQIARIERRDRKRAERFRAVASEINRYREDQDRYPVSKAEVSAAILNAPSRYASAPRIAPLPGGFASDADLGAFRLEMDGIHGGWTYPTHAEASAVARELSASRGPGGEGYAHGIVYVNREVTGGGGEIRRIPAGAYARGRRAA